ncbi:MAG TPA: PqqD family protein [Acidimicrobiia bacterium]|nr:PqqD family protein [Acidimicrobiia bacterium]
MGRAFVAQQSPDVFTVTIDGEAVLLDEVEQRLHHLNAPATLVWSCLDGHASVDQLARELSEELAVSYDVVLVDTLEIVRDLDAQELLVGSPRRDPDQ